MGIVAMLPRLLSSAVSIATKLAPNVGQTVAKAEKESGALMHRDGFAKQASGTPSGYGQVAKRKEEAGAEGAKASHTDGGATTTHKADEHGAAAASGSDSDEKPKMSKGEKMMMGLGAAGAVFGLGDLFGSSNSDSSDKDS